MGDNEGDAEQDTTVPVDDAEIDAAEPDSEPADDTEAVDHEPRSKPAHTIEHGGAKPDFTVPTEDIDMSADEAGQDTAEGHAGPDLESVDDAEVATAVLVERDGDQEIGDAHPEAAATVDAAAEPGGPAPPRNDAA
ncbi:hypothetical protein SAMN04489835_4872 [Mycolicibacterium rutilum]|uniref:Uncharacterized protein n=1 Tax=Mycolicibacterium rutilum TaxID=370526 RepID=A0A1H6LJS2_MYCRU|nr:hypothetical protein [Mycolicibacterium rutilum]SEH85043.1 hypothetical protein SAMN04489835_4872 [Mycolicibacterium rutilum]